MTKSNKSVQKVTGEEKFIPNQDMVKWLNTSMELQTNTLTDIEAACNIRRQQWYRWIELEGFEDWYYAEYEKRLARLRPNVDRIGWKFAERGSYNHLELMAKRTGAIKEEGGINIQGEKVVAILGGSADVISTNDSDKETSQSN